MSNRDTAKEIENTMKSKYIILILVIVFVSITSARAQTLPILTVEDVGTPMENLYVPHPPFTYLKWSPDRQWVAYNKDDNSCLYTKPVAGGDSILVYTYDQFAEQFEGDPNYSGLTNAIGSFTFTPDGQEITFEIRIYDPDLGSTIEFEYDENGHFKSFSGRYPLPYIKSININTGEVRELATGLNPTWDPTGRYLIYENYDYRDKVDGLQPENHKLPMILDTHTGESRVLDDESWDAYSYWEVSLDRQYVFYDKRTEEEIILSNGKKTTQLQLFRCPLAGGEPEQILHPNGNYAGGTNLLISPDGNWLFFTKITNIWRDHLFEWELDDDPTTVGTSHSQGPAIGLCVMNIETGDVYDLIPHSEYLVLTPLGISPDGTTLYVTVNDKYLGAQTFFIAGYFYRPIHEWVVAIDFNPEMLGEPVFSGIEHTIPVAFPTIANYPNPFNPLTTITFSLPDGGFTELAVYNIAGQRIRTLVVGELSMGVHEVVWDGCDDTGNPVSSGIYVSRLIAGDTVVTNRMTLVK